MTSNCGKIKAEIDLTVTKELEITEINLTVPASSDENEYLHYPNMHRFLAINTD